MNFLFTSPSVSLIDLLAWSKNQISLGYNPYDMPFILEEIRKSASNDWSFNFIATFSFVDHFSSSILHNVNSDVKSLRLWWWWCCYCWCHGRCWCLRYETHTNTLPSLCKNRQSNKKGKKFSIHQNVDALRDSYMILEFQHINTHDESVDTETRWDVKCKRKHTKCLNRWECRQRFPYAYEYFFPFHAISQALVRSFHSQ